MPSYARTVYWDSCVWLAWLKREEWPEEDWQGMHEVAHMVMADKWVLLGSVLVRTEVMVSRLPAEVAKQFNDLRQRRNVVLQDADERISQLAEEIRAFYMEQGKTDGLGGIGTPDAIHLATAIHHGAHVFHTFDDGQKDGKKGRSLLSLDGDVAGRRLAISRPRALQARLSLS